MVTAHLRASDRSRRSPSCARPRAQRCCRSPTADRPRAVATASTARRCGAFSASWRSSPTIQHEPAGRGAEEARSAVRRRLIYIERLGGCVPTTSPSASRWPASRSRPARADGQLLEDVVAAAPKYSEACALLATVYYRLQRKADGDRMRARGRGAERRSPGAAAGRQATWQPYPRPALRPGGATLRSFRQGRRSETRRLADGEPAERDVRLAVAVHVADVERRMRRRAGFERALELPRRRLSSQTSDGRPADPRRRPAAPSPRYRDRRRHRDRPASAVRARQGRQPMLDERERARVLEADDAMGGFSTRSSKLSPCASSTSRSPSLSRSTSSMPDDPQFGCGPS